MKRVILWLVLGVLASGASVASEASKASEECRLLEQMFEYSRCWSGSSPELRNSSIQELLEMLGSDGREQVRVLDEIQDREEKAAVPWIVNKIRQLNLEIQEDADGCRMDLVVASFSDWGVDEVEPRNVESTSSSNSPSPRGSALMEQADRGALQRRIVWRREYFDLLLSLDPHSFLKSVHEAMNGASCPLQRMRFAVVLSWADPAAGLEVAREVCSSDSVEARSACAYKVASLLNTHVRSADELDAIQDLVEQVYIEVRPPELATLLGDWHFMNRLGPSPRNYPHWHRFVEIFSKAEAAWDDPEIRKVFQRLVLGHRAYLDQAEKVRSPQEVLKREEERKLALASGPEELADIVRTAKTQSVRFSALQRLYFCCASDYETLFEDAFEEVLADSDMNGEMFKILAAQGMRRNGSERGREYLRDLLASNSINEFTLVYSFLDPSHFERIARDIESPLASKRAKVASRLGVYLRIEVEGIEDIEVLRALERLISDESPEVRLAASKVVWESMTTGWRGLPGRSALPSVVGWGMLRHLADDPDEKVRRAYLGYLQEWESDPSLRRRNEEWATATVERIRERRKDDAP